MKTNTGKKAAAATKKITTGSMGEKAAAKKSNVRNSAVDDEDEDLDEDLVEEEDFELDEDFEEFDLPKSKTGGSNKAEDDDFDADDDFKDLDLFNETFDDEDDEDF